MKIIDPNTGKPVEVKNEFMQKKVCWGGTKKGTGDKARIHYQTANGERFSVGYNK